jgi:predicted transcriptional regulator
MKLIEIIQILDAEILCTVKNESHVEITMACGADFMNDVLAFIKSNTLLLTGLTTPQVVYTAENAGVNVICFVRGKKPGEEVVALARRKEIILLATKSAMFESCGKLYKNGLIGCSEISKQSSLSGNI